MRKGPQCQGFRCIISNFRKDRFSTKHWFVFLQNDRKSAARALNERKVNMAPHIEPLCSKRNQGDSILHT